MSVVEKSAPRWRIVGIGVAIAVALVAVVAVMVSVVSGSSPSADPAVEPPSTTRRSTSATLANAAAPLRVAPIEIDFDRDDSYRVYLERTGVANTVYVFAYIDPLLGELHYLDQNQIVYGRVVGRFADRLVVEGGSLHIIDRDFATPPVSIEGDHFVGTWSDHAVVAEYFPERTSFHEYDRDGREVGSVALVGRRPNIVGGIVRDSIVVERAGRLLLLGLKDATAREFAVGHLLGVGGDRIYYTTCTPQAACTINEATLDGIVRTTPIGRYLEAGSELLFASVAPDGSALLLHDYDSGDDVVLEHGARLHLTAEMDRSFHTWAATGGWLFRVDDASKQLEAIDYRAQRSVLVPLPADDAVSLRSVAAW